MSGYVFHPEAYADLDDIWESIAEDNPNAADRVLAEIFESIRGLVPFPHQGHRRSDLTSRPLRFHTVRNFVVAYPTKSLRPSAREVYRARDTKLEREVAVKVLPERSLGKSVERTPCKTN